jgi:signal transduction histidine kinase/CheY-like chemotaxis protein
MGEYPVHPDMRKQSDQDAVKASADRFGSFTRPIALRLLFSKVSDAPDDELDAELAQCKVRFAIFIIVVSYITISSMVISPVNAIEPWARAVLIYYCFHSIISLGIYALVRIFPGHYPGRRALSMVNDYAGLGYSIIAGCTVMLPVYAIIVWITVGNGMRFGRTYLYAASILGQITIAVVFLLTPHLRADPTLALTLSITALIVPVYATVLLRRIELAKQAAEAASTAKSRFLAQASHDLRQPLHAINLFLFSLQQTGLNSTQATIADRIDRSLQGVGNLFRSLLDISTLDSGSIQPHIEPVPLGELLSEIVQQNAQLAKWSGTELRIVKTRHMVLADRALLTTMIQNLISNALKFAEGRRVLVGCRLSGETVSIQIWDSGDGIPAKHLSFIFDEFFQVKKSSDPDRQGVGLGLSIVARMAELMNLTIAADSRPGAGSVFTIGALPLLGSAKRPAEIGSRFMPGAPIAGMEIILVEDDPDVLAATKDMLDAWGCKVSAFTAIPEKIDQYDLIITDYDLGDGKSGADCIAVIRQANRWPIPAIIVTGHDEGRITREVDDLEISVLKKPVRPAELRSAIGAARTMSMQKPGASKPMSSWYVSE